MKKYLIIVLAITCSLLTGCRSTKPAAEKPTSKPSTTEVAKPKVEYYSATVEGSYEGISVSGLVRMEKDKIIWVSLSKFIELGRAVATPDSVHAYVKILNSAFHGTYADLEKKCGIHTDFATLQKILMEHYPADNKTSEICLPRYKSKICGKVRFKTFERSENLSFPLNIPKNAKPFFK